MADAEPNSLKIPFIKRGECTWSLELGPPALVTTLLEPVVGTDALAPRLGLSAGMLRLRLAARRCVSSLSMESVTDCFRMAVIFQRGCIRPDELGALATTLCVNLLASSTAGLSGVHGIWRDDPAC